VRIHNTTGISRRHEAVPVFEIFTRCHLASSRLFRIHLALLAGLLDTFDTFDSKYTYTEEKLMPNFLNLEQPLVANYRVTNETDEYIQLVDVGPHDQYKTITNAAEWVVQQMVPRLKGRKLYYEDSNGDVDQLVIHAGKFAGFARGGPDDRR
jgi:hypothetical protein